MMDNNNRGVRCSNLVLLDVDDGTRISIEHHLRRRGVEVLVINNRPDNNTIPSASFDVQQILSFPMTSTITSSNIPEWVVQRSRAERAFRAELEEIERAVAEMKRARHRFEPPPLPVVAVTTARPRRPPPTRAPWQVAMRRFSGR